MLGPLGTVEAGDGTFAGSRDPGLPTYDCALATAYSRRIDTGRADTHCSKSLASRPDKGSDSLSCAPPERLILYRIHNAFPFLGYPIS